MKLRMPSIITDYKDMIIKPSCMWMKKHWKGYLGLCAASGIASYAWFKHQEKKLYEKEEDDEEDLFIEHF